MRVHATLVRNDLASPTRAAARRGRIAVYCLPVVRRDLLQEAPLRAVGRVAIACGERAVDALVRGVGVGARPIVFT